jgi:hypothetical protein
MRADKIDAAADGRAVDVGLYALSAVFAGLTAATSTLLPHRAWGAVAVGGYAVAALVAFRFRETATRLVIALGAFVAVGLVPMLVQAVQRAGGRGDRAQEEVWVVEHAGARLWETGSPYLGRAGILALPAADRLDGYMPYQPGMAVFGLLRAIAGAGWWTDSRVWFALVFVVTVGWALRVSGGFGGRGAVRAVQFAAVFPVCALTLATGGDDMPILGLCLLALAFAGRERWTAAGVAVGIAGAMKLFAWPVALVLIGYALLRNRRSGGLAWPDALRVAAGGFGLPLLALVPVLIVGPDALVENVLRFPMGHGVVTSPAQSPFPGYLIAHHLPGGGTIANVLLLLAGLAIAGWLVRRSPRDAAGAAFVCAVGMVAVILLLQATRFGYVLYPVAFVGWMPQLRSGA